MKIIAKNANPSGAYPPIMNGASRVYDGHALIPDTFDDAVFYENNGFVTLTIEKIDGVETVVGMEPNEAARTAWKATLPAEPDPIDAAREEKEAEISKSCNEAIVAGMDVETSVGTEHFSLQETDQINLTTATNAVQNGATGYPYHADGSLCRMFSAEEILAIAEASIQHKLYHTTLCNHLLTWVRRAETVEEVEGITYTPDNLPDDLAHNMASIFAATASV